jgi:hypothetical protein
MSALTLVAAGRRDVVRASVRRVGRPPRTTLFVSGGDRMRRKALRNASRAVFPCIQEAVNHALTAAFIATRAPTDYAFATPMILLVTLPQRIFLSRTSTVPTSEAVALATPDEARVPLGRCLAALRGPGQRGVDGG